MNKEQHIFYGWQIHLTYQGWRTFDGYVHGVHMTQIGTSRLVALQSYKTKEEAVEAAHTYIVTKLK